MILELLIDADSAIYKAGCANETRSYLIHEVELGSIVKEFKYKKEAVEWVEKESKKGGSYDITPHKVAGPLSHALANVKLVMKNTTALQHTDRQVFISGKGNFRYDIYPAYKGQRDSFSKPIQEEEIREYLIKYWGAQTVDEEEADDRVSYLQCLSEYKSTCIVSIDKDLLNTPGYNFNYDKQELRWISREEADLNFARQLLTGDSTDNIPGLKRYGPARALKILPEWSDAMLEDVAEEYRKMYEGDWLEVMNMNGILLWMRREPNQMWTYGDWRWDDE